MDPGIPIIQTKPLTLIKMYAISQVVESLVRIRKLAKSQKMQMQFILS